MIGWIAMEVTGTVTRASHRKTPYGSVFASVLISTARGQDMRFRYLMVQGVPRVREGQVVTIEGMPVMGGKTNIGGVTVTIHDQED